MKQAILSFAAAALVSTSGWAQQVSFVGKVEDVSGTANQFFLDCTDSQLTSAVFDLNAFIGLQVEITGNWNGSIVNPSVDVTSIAAVPETFEIGGGLKIGDTSSLGFTGSPGDAVVGFLATAPSFLPLNGNQDVLMLDPLEIRLTAAGTIGGTGILELPFQVPDNPALVGLEVFGQGAFAVGGGFTLTNPDCKDISD